MPIDLGTQMQQLYRDFGELPGITIELHQQLLAIRVDNEKASATIFLQGAQVSDFQPNGCNPIIWCSDQCNYAAGTPLRGGIPICWPWFGDLNRNPAEVKQQILGNSDTQILAPHGFVRNQPWQLATISIVDADTTQLTFRLVLDGTEDPLWPHACELTYTVTVGSVLSLELCINNKSRDTVNFSSALHTYYSVDNIEHTTLNGLEGCRYTDCMDEWKDKDPESQLLVNCEIDRIYRGATDRITINEKNQRNIIIESDGSHSTVVWNPWIEKSARLSQFSNSDYQKMICVETANVGTDFVRLAPNQTHRLAVTIYSTESVLIDG
ncbi:MAG: D-hexose-6-phosphate mutarotase [Oceanicoccus sp.]